LRTAGRTAKGLFNKVRNQATRRRFVVSTIKKGEDLFETAVFEVNFFYLPRRWSNPDLAVETRAKDEAWDLHHQLAARLAQEYPARLFEEYRS
jgi:DNA-binding MarR family transcriptional regulator